MLISFLVFHPILRWNYLNMHQTYIHSLAIKQILNLKQDSIEIKESRIYPGDIIIARERLIEIYNEVRAKGIENYQPNIISLKYLCNFLKNWNKIYEYLSSDYSIDILAITTKVESFIGLLMNYLKKDSNFLIKVYEMIGTVYRNLAEFKKLLIIMKKH